jgi:hypothetical protein
MRHVLAAILATAAAALPAVADDKYDLRGPAPVKGQVTVNKTKMVIKEADTNVVVAGQKVAMTMTMTMTSEEEHEALTVDGRQITKVKEKIVKDGVQVKATVFGQANEEDKPADLEGETVVGERGKDGKWTYKLEDAKPTEEQEKELKRKHGPENDDELYPAEKVAAGHKWEVDAAKMKSLTGNAMSDVKGKMKQHFVKVEKVDGEECAVIESSGKLTAKMVPEEDGDPAPDVVMEVTKATSWRSLKTGLEVKGTFDGKIKIAGKQKAEGQEVEIEMEGPITGQSTTRFKEKK